ncbi:MAG: HAD hydrolase-like protein, partial [bacterium]
MRAVLFDLDDTLYPEISFVRSGFRTVAQHLADTESLAEEELFERLMSVLKRDGRGRVFDTVLREVGQNRPGLVAVLVRVYRTHRPNIRLFKDVEPGLQRLRAMGLRMGIVTDGLASVQRNKIGALRLEPLVDTLVCTDEVGPGQEKPSVR